MTPQPDRVAQVVAWHNRRLVAYFKGRAEEFRAAAKRQGKRVGPRAKAYDEAARAILEDDMSAIEAGEPFNETPGE